MAWIESHQELARHPKTRRLMRILKTSLPTTIGHLHLFWWWALDYAQDGNLSRYNVDDIADAAMWDGPAGDFVDAMCEAGFLDKSPEGTLKIHDWNDYAGRLIEKRRQDAERKRKAREKEKDVQETSNGCPADIQRTAQVTVPNRTVPNSTSTSTPPPPSPTLNGVEEGAPEQPLKGPFEQEQPGEQRKQAKTPETTDEQPMMPTKSIKRRAKTPVNDALFARFWAAYPKKRSKGQAERAWAKINPDEQLVETMLAAIERAKTSEEWRKEGGRYIPYPATWLNAKGWEDEYQPLEVINGERGQKHRGVAQAEDDYSDLIIR